MLKSFQINTVCMKGPDHPRTRIRPGLVARARSANKTQRFSPSARRITL